MSLIHNERKRLLANASTACFTVGIATPIAGYLYNVGNIGETISGIRLALGLIGWLLAAIALHLFARRVLKGLVS